MKGPLILLADSQLLFPSSYGRWFREHLLAHTKTRANNGQCYGVYIGASNSHEPAFYEMAKEAFQPLGVQECVFMKTGLEDLGKLADLNPAVILLAGGDVALGWEFLKQAALKNWLDECYDSGTAMLGISAGAIHLTGCVQAPSLLGYEGFVTMVHEEAENWPGFKTFKEQESLRSCVRIPFGSGLWVNAKSKATTFGRAPSEFFIKKNSLDIQQKNIPYYP